MTLEVLDDVDSVARHAAEIIATEARAAVRARGRFTVAISGGRTPWVMLRALSERDDVPWQNVHLLQVDERVAPADHADRNLTHLRESLLARSQAGAAQIHAMPVEWDDLDEAAARYGHTLADIAGSPPVIDLVHLGLGPDGHTASLVPEVSNKYGLSHEKLNCDLCVGHYNFLLRISGYNGKANDDRVRIDL